MDADKGFKVIPILESEVHSLSRNLDSQITQLTHSFELFLKEPRFQSPLTLEQLSKLFQNFYNDLNSLCINHFTQSNSVKKLLIAQSEYFRSNPEKYDYLLAIANSKSGSKLSRRTDNDALYQLRVFNFYKFLVIVESIQEAQVQLFQSGTSIADQDSPLIDKVFRFDERDCVFQEFLDDKLNEVKKLNLSFSYFLEKDAEDRLTPYLQLVTETKTDSSTLDAIKALFLDLKDSVAPNIKLQILVSIQKMLIIFLSEIYEIDSAEINNDYLIPAFIYIMVYYMPSSGCDLYLNFKFIKHFLNTIDPYDLEISNQGYSSYKSNPPIGAKGRFLTSRQNLFELLNLKEEEYLNPEKSSTSIEFFDNDKDLIGFISSKYLNNGESKFYLTNLEASLFYFSNLTFADLKDISGATSKVLITPLDKLVEAEVLNNFQFPEGKIHDEARKQLDESRSRSSSLLNSIGSKLTDVASSVNRSRSNSANTNTHKRMASKENFPSLGQEGENMTVRSLLGRLSSVSVSMPSFKYSHEDVSSTNTTDSTVRSPEYKPKRKTSRVVSLQAGASSSSLDVTVNDGDSSTGTTKAGCNPKRNSITNRFTNGVSDFITKFNTPSNAGVSNTSSPQKTISVSSLHSLDEALHETTSSIDHNLDEVSPENTINISKRPSQITRNSSVSLQIMDRFFSNLGHSNLQKAPESGAIELLSNTDSAMKEVIKYWNIDFDQLTVSDLKMMKIYYDRLCNELILASLDENSQKSDPIEMTSNSENSI